MIGKMTLFILSLFMMFALLISFVSIANQNSIENHLYDFIGENIEKISMEGIISSSDYEDILKHLHSLGSYEIHIKYNRKISKKIYEVIIDLNQILDRELDKGDIVNIIVSQHGNTVFNKVAYVMINSQEYFMGYEVIKDIRDEDISIFVRNKGQAEYIEYDRYNNPIYGDDEIEQAYNKGYISEYAKYIRREEYSEGELIYISYTEN